ncbi:MAG: hypothetical protein IT430_05000 [Phycisphaerales bacterium]|nr:hypothetical protein [Phycisphaerales bacterium]
MSATPAAARILPDRGAVLIRSLLLAVLMLGLLGVRGALAQDSRYEALKQQAEQFYAEKSYSRAHELYEQAQKVDVPAAEQRWVRFRLADTLWRAAPDDVADDAVKTARKQLTALVDEIDRMEDRDLVWAAANESLGDSWLQGARRANAREAWPFYAQALQWWGSSSDIDAARDRYISMVWRALDAEGGDWSWRGRSPVVPLDVLRNVLEIAQNDSDRTRAHFEIAMKMRYVTGRDPRPIQQVTEHFEAALETDARDSRYVDALMAYAEWCTRYGQIEVLESGQWTWKPDYVRAAELYKRLLDEFKAEEIDRDEVVRRYNEIVLPALDVYVSHAFLPNSEIAFDAQWRNVKQIDFILYRVNLRERTALTGAMKSGEQDNRRRYYGSAVDGWIRHVDLNGAEVARRWSKQTGDTGRHEPMSDQIRLEEPLPAGAYILVAQAGADLRVVDLVLVSDLAVVSKRRGNDVLLYACDALTGAPAPDVQFRAWDLAAPDEKWTGNSYTAAADSHGIAHLQAKPATGSSENVSLLILAGDGARQTFLTSYEGYWWDRSDESVQWRIYAHSDRPAYRPGDTANYRFVARTWSPNGWTTPAERTLHYRIVDPRDTAVFEGETALSEFGSAFASLQLQSDWPLGEYTIRFSTLDAAGDESQVASATLFRVEEYKLPEFIVTVKPLEDDEGQPHLFRMGDVVTADIVAEYYFGGPVASADVEVVVKQRPFWQTYEPPRPYPWLYEDANRWNSYGWWSGETIKTETLKTDSEGRARITFETPFDADQDYEYTIEARVTDLSRREITGSGSVRVTRQSYFVYPEVAHKIHRPGDKIETSIKALDPNGSPVAVEGTVTVMRQWWDEVWVDPAGREVLLDGVERLREQYGVFPPPPRPEEHHRWQPIFRGYRSEKVTSEKVTTDEDGEATFTFTAQREGYYIIEWASPDPPLVPVTAQTAAWVTTQQTASLGYHNDGVELIVDKDTFALGATAPVMISTSSSNRYVLFTIEGEELYDWQLVHVAGNVKLLNIEVREAYIPNVFLAAAMVSGAAMAESSQEIIIPPVEQFLNVAVKADQEMYEPGAEGTLQITTTDQQGRPVAAEVAVSVFDESVLYIQSAYAGDPRAFFYDRKQRNAVTTDGSLEELPLIRLVKTESGRYEDARFAAEKKEGARSNAAVGFEGGGGGSTGNFFRDDDGGATSFEGAAAYRMASPASKAAGSPPPPPPAGSPEQGQPPADIVVRTDFRATAFWDARVITDDSGTATVTVPYPQTLTRWKAEARANTTGARFGMGETTARTNKPITVRIQGPRFITVGDEFVISYIVRNNTDERISQLPFVDMEGLIYRGRRGGDGNYHDRLAPGAGRVIDAGGETRFDLKFIADKSGTAAVSVSTKIEDTDISDAVRATFPVHDHGIDKFVAVSGKARGDQAIVTLDLPEARRVGTTSMSVQVTPSMAVTMLDALPYLLEYPYGCVEQTMSRFLPAVIVNRTLADLGLDAEEVAKRTFGGIEMVDGKPAQPRDDAKGLDQLDEIVAAGLSRLDDMQHDDGGWGWWKGGESDRYMTAYVVWGLGLARQAELDVPGDMITPGADYLVQRLNTARDVPELQAWMLHALAASKATSLPLESHGAVATAFDNLWQKRDQLSATGRALLALSAHHLGKAEQAQTLARNLENGVIRDDRPDQSILVKNADGSPATVLGTAHWGRESGYRYWWDGGIESTTLCLRALLAIAPQSELIEPATNWLIRNRRGAQWTNTRDTAMAVLTLCDYLRASGELEATGRYEVMVNGRLVGKSEVTRESILSAPAVFAVPEASIQSGANTIRIRRLEGDTALYFAAQAEFFSTEEPVTPAGNEIFVRRDYYRLVPAPTLLSGVEYVRVPLKDEDHLNSGDRVEVVLTIEAKNDYEYLVLEDLKPAGFEATQIRSGESMYIHQIKNAAAQRLFAQGEATDQDGRREFDPWSITGDASNLTGRSRWVHQELRDRKVVFFVDQLGQGYWQVRYEARAEVPGRFHAMPLLGHAMYVPEIRANSSEIRVNVEERPGTP